MRVIFVVGCLLAAVNAQGQLCPSNWYPKSHQCPQDCGREEDYRGCIQCTCGGGVVPALPPCYSPADYGCPPQPFCGTQIDNGCLSCTCGVEPTLSCPVLTDQQCPDYCSRTLDEKGCETCDCNTGSSECSAPWYPAGSMCPQDCGQEKDYRGCIQCTCGGEVVPALPPCYTPGDYVCPPFCSAGTPEIIDDSGCLSCTCGATPIRV